MTSVNNGSGKYSIPDRSSFIHTTCYCEENVYFLCQKLSTMGIADHKGGDLFVAFISNKEKKIPLWCQSASKRLDGLVVWDYHVICIQKNDGDNGHVVWDLDSTLPFPVAFKRYFSQAILPTFPLDPLYKRIFRVIHAPIFLRFFASDRSHMKDLDGTWISPPPVYPPIVAQDGTSNNLADYIRMDGNDVTSDIQTLINHLYSNQYGVLVSETMLEKLFS